MSRARTATARVYPPGTLLFNEGDLGKSMFVIRSGKVKIFRRNGGTELVLAFLESGEFFGEMALLEGLPRSAAAQVVEPSTLIEFDQGTFEDLLERNRTVAVRMMRKLSGRVRELDTRLETMLLDGAQGRALEVLRWIVPMGEVEGDWVRVAGVGPHLNIAAQAGVPPAQAASVLKALIRAGCIRFEGEDVLVAGAKKLESYESYLRLKHEYGGAVVDADDEKIERQKAMRNLMKVLRCSPEQVEAEQSSLMTKYERYLQLKDRFKDLDVQ